MALSMQVFAKLLLVMMAKESNEVHPFWTKTVTVRIPFNYRDRIENILCAGNGWKEKFSILIDTDDYFKDHFWWEERLAKEILNVVEEFGTTLKMDLVKDQILIDFDLDKVNEVLSTFKDEKVRDIIKHFASLVTCILYSREHQEEFVDYTAKSRKLMHEALQKEYRQGLEDD